MEPWMQKHTLADWRDDNFRKKRYFGSGRHVLLEKHCILRMQEDQERIHVNKHQSPSISLKSNRDKVRHVSPYNVVSSISRQQSEKHFVGTL